MHTSTLVGSWRLVSCQHIRADGTIELPFGPEPIGRLVYSAEGTMIVLITDPARPLARSPQFFEATEQELASAAQGCVAYSGRWSIRSGEVIHEVEQSLFPNWRNVPLARSFKFDGEKLVLSTEPFFIKGVKYTAALVWEREANGK